MLAYRALPGAGFIMTFLVMSGSVQDCQTSTNGAPFVSSVRELDGQLVFHDDLRQWFELKLNSPVCGEKSIELITGDKGWSALQVLRGCPVKSSGQINISETGYYSLNLYQNVSDIRPTSACKRMQPFPDYSKRRPEASLRNYHVIMRLHYQTDGPLDVEVANGHRPLRPWQIYSSYSLTGDFGYYAFCGKGFVAEKPHGTPEGKPWVLDGYIAFDPESVPKGVDPIFLKYDCRRTRRGE